MTPVKSRFNRRRTNEISKERRQTSTSATEYICKKSSVDEI